MAKKYKTGFELNEEGLGSWSKIILQSEMKKRGLGYRELTELLNARLKQTEDERNVRNKIGRGKFSAGFFLMCLVAMDCPEISLSTNDIIAKAIELGPISE
jgi:hypothetical protein